jgi:WD40 repeat protein
MHTMANAKMSPTRARERALFLYRSALERGDFDAIAAVLKMAERDPLLWQMIDDLVEVDEGALEKPRTEFSRSPRNDKSIQQHITVSDPSSNGQTPKTDHSQEDYEMTILTVETFTPERPRTLYPLAMRFITLAAALFIVILVGGLLIEMVSDPMDGYPAIQALETEEPKCSVDTIADPGAEAERLGNAADSVLDKQHREGVELATLLAVCALRTGYSMDADAALQRSLNSLEFVPLFPNHDSGFNTTVLSPDGQYVAVGSVTEYVLWDSSNGERVHTFNYDRSPDTLVNPAAFSPDSNLLLTYHNIGIARLWDVETGEAIRDLDFTDNAIENGRILAIISMAFSPDGAHVLLGMSNGDVQVWDVNTGAMEHSFQSGTGNVFSVTYSLDGQNILTAILDDTVARLWKADNAELVREFASSGSLNSAALSPDSRFVLTAGDGEEAILYDAETGEAIHTFTGFEGGVNVAAFSPDGQSVLIGGVDMTARMYDLESLVEVRSFTTLNGNAVASLAFSSDGAIALVAGLNASGRTWPTTIEGMIALACSTVTRDFTAEERAEYGLGEGAVCP